MRLHLLHTTTYEYSEPVPESLLQLRLTPIASADQTVISWTIDLDGAQRETEYTDHHGNQVVLVRLAANGRRLLPLH